MSGEQVSKQQRVILSLTVEIQDGREEHIEVREGDSAELVAKRFVGQHSLPQQFETPLAELIVDNIIRLSKDEKWRKENKPTPTQRAPPRVARRPDTPSSSPARSPVKFPSRQKSSGQEKKEKPPKKYHRQQPTHHRVSERLLSHTYTFKAKTSVFGHLEQSRKPKQRPLSDKEKALYMRLHMDFMKHRQKIEEGRKVLHAQYVERLSRTMVRSSKRSKRLVSMRNTAAQKFKNYGELLYQDGVDKLQERKLLIQKKKEEVEANELVGYTWKPEISQLAKELKQKQSVWLRLQDSSKLTERLQDLRNEALEAQIMECTFRPRINVIHDMSDSLIGSRFDQLFLDAEIRRKRQAEYAQWYPEGVTFRPSISQSQHSHPDVHEDMRVQGMTVFDRLVHYAERSNHLKQKLLEEITRPIDPSTGQEFFTPLTGRRPQTERNSSLLPIGEFLYQMHFELDHKKRSKVENSDNERVKLANVEYALPRSLKLLRELEARSIQQIFRYLDVDGDDLVDLDAVDMTRLMNEVVEDIEEMKRQMRLAGQPLTANYETFARLLAPIRKARKRGIHVVVRTRRLDDPFRTFTFRFKMSKYSRALAIRRRKYKGTTEWYSILHQERGKRHSKIEDIQKNLQKAQLSECSFKPVIHSKRAKSFLKMHYLPRNAPTMEKEQQEVHGFIFSDGTPPPHQHPPPSHHHHHQLSEGETSPDEEGS